MEKTNWIIAISKTNDSETCLLQFFGTKEEVKKKLIEIIAEERRFYRFQWDFGCTDIEDITWKNNQYVGYGCYKNFDIHYTAKEIQNVKVIGEDESIIKTRIIFSNKRKKA